MSPGLRNKISVNLESVDWVDWNS